MGSIIILDKTAMDDETRISIEN